MAVLSRPEIIVVIRLTRMDGTPIVLNAELIRYVEQLPDTYVTLTSGDRMIVLEKMDVVMERAIEYQQQKSLLPKLPTITHSSQIPSSGNKPSIDVTDSNR